MAGYFNRGSGFVCLKRTVGSKYRALCVPYIAPFLRFKERFYRAIDDNKFKYANSDREIYGYARILNRDDDDDD